MNKDIKMIMTKLQGATPLIWVETHEESRTLAAICQEIDQMNKDGSLIDGDGQAVKFNLFTWSRASGIRPVGIKGGKMATGEMIKMDVEDPDHVDEGGAPMVRKMPSIDPTDPLTYLKDKAPGGTVMILKDYHKYFDVEHYQHQDIVLSKIRDDIEGFKADFKSIIILSSVVRIPEEIEKDIYKLSFSLPDRDELKAILKALCKTLGTEYPKTDEADIIDAALGLTQIEFENAISHSLVETLGERIDPAIVRSQKAEQVKKAGLLDVIQTVETLDSIGGLEILKEWLRKKADCFPEDAKDFGCRTPKGLLLVGIPGTGKSLTAKAIASAWHRPLLRFDIGKVFDMYQGNSEMKMRRCQAIAEAVAPCVLWIDEVEKGMAGTKGSGAGDSHGTTKRVFGSLLTWFSEKTADVFIVATANNVDSIPDELYRPGRIDASFWLDLPDAVQREEILRIHISKSKRSIKKDKARDPNALFTKDEMKKLVEITKNLSGAGIEVLVNEAVETAWNAGHGDRDVCLADFEEAVKRVSKTNREHFASALKWKEDHQVPNASINHPEAAVAPQATTVTGDRKIGLNLGNVKLAVKPAAPKAEGDADAKAA